MTVFQNSRPGLRSLTVAAPSREGGEASGGGVQEVPMPFRNQFSTGDTRQILKNQVEAASSNLQHFVEGLIVVITSSRIESNTRGLIKAISANEADGTISIEMALGSSQGALWRYVADVSCF